MSHIDCRFMKILRYACGQVKTIYFGGKKTLAAMTEPQNQVSFKTNAECVIAAARVQKAAYTPYQPEQQTYSLQPQLSRRARVDNRHT